MVHYLLATLLNIVFCRPYRPISRQLFLAEVTASCQKPHIGLAGYEIKIHISDKSLTTKQSQGSLAASPFML